MTDQPQSGGEALPGTTTIGIDPVAAHFERRMKVAENEGLLAAARERDLVNLCNSQKATIARLEAELDAMRAPADTAGAAGEAG